MKRKIVYTLIGLFVSGGISNAADRLALTDAKGGKQLTSSQGIQGASKTMEDFTNASKQKVTLQTQISPTDYVQIEGVVAYLGQDLYGLPHFMEYLKGCVDQYKPGMKVNAAKEIVILPEDAINMATFGRYVVQNLFSSSLNLSPSVTPAFVEFSRQDVKPFGSCSYSNNCVLYSLMYCFDNSSVAVPVVIEHPQNKYNNLKFKFLPCSDEEKASGKQLDFSFNADDIGYERIVKLYSNTKDTLEKPLFGGYNLYQALYKFTAFKLDNDSYRVQLILSSKDSPSDRGEFVDRKITNLKLNLK